MRSGSPLLSLGLGAALLAGCAAAGAGSGWDGRAQVPPQRGPVLETLDSGGFTYLRVAVAGRDVWAAGPQTRLAVGDVVALPGGAELRDYASRSLQRRFDAIVFVGAIEVVGGPPGAPADDATSAHGAGHGGGSASDGGEVAPVPPEAVEIGAVARAPGGKTVAEVFAEAATLAGSVVTVRGRVVKANLGIMGHNWLHLRDGSGGAGTNDLTVTTAEVAAVGDLVVATGKVAVDQSFGDGAYTYPVLLEGARIVRE